MMHSTETISVWLERILGHEGGYTDGTYIDADGEPFTDPGGETKWGISKRAYPHLDIPSLTVDDAVSIYVVDYLLPLQAHKYGPALAYQMLDYAINSGVKGAIRGLQRMLGVTVDGVIGPVTLAELVATEKRDTHHAARLIAERLDYLTSIKGWDKFGKGWTRRMAANLRYAVG